SDAADLAVAGRQYKRGGETVTNLQKYYAPEDVRQWKTLALGIGAAATFVMALALLLYPDLREQALRSWLLGVIFWGGIGFGGLGILMLQYLTGGAWGVVVRRTVEAAARTWPMIALLFLPVAIGVLTATVYQWTHLPPTDHVMEHRGWYMTQWGWIERSIVYFVL